MADKLKKLGVIAGTGFEKMDGVEVVDERSFLLPRRNLWVQDGVAYTDWRLGGERGPNPLKVDVKVTVCQIGETEVYFIARHGPGHIYAPHRVPYAANIQALKMCGVPSVLSVTSLGGLRDCRPGDMLNVTDYDGDQGMILTFFGEDGLVAHAPMADPGCGKLRHGLVNAICEIHKENHPGDPDKNIWEPRSQTLSLIPGPHFGTKLQGRIRARRTEAVGMTAFFEAKLAREACMGHAALGMITDMDAHEDGVTGDVVHLQARINKIRAQRIIHALASQFMPTGVSDHCNIFATGAVHTAQGSIPQALTQEVGEWLPEFQVWWYEELGRQAKELGKNKGNTGSGPHAVT